MKITCNHIGFNVKDLAASREFYLNKLGLELVEDTDSFFSVLAGNIKFSFALTEVNSEKAKEHANVNLIMHTDDVEIARDEIAAKGIKLLYDISEVNDYKFFTIEDPDKNVIHIGKASN